MYMFLYLLLFIIFYFLYKDEEYVISKLKTPIYSLYVADKTASVVMAYFGDSARNINIGDVLRLENV